MSGRAGGLDWGRGDWVLATIAASPVSAEQRRRLLVPVTQRAAPAAETGSSSSTVSLSAELHAGIS
ncbi:hypothetical protein CVT25_002424 [Psilocybe cyanescens]|uniref:Uncharacterized protein n=1 Tax=Psilocybe cyanescens TaxID=93625 RepID=A0A409X0E0_PSICY|nr:hypothetical protein CVT25_002424 [Psilocybe cyanescens]